MSSVVFSDKSQPYVNARTGRGVLVRIIRIVLRFRVRLLIGLAATITTSLMQLMIPRLMGTAVDAIYNFLSAAEQWSPLIRNQLVSLGFPLLVFSMLRGFFMAVYLHEGEVLGQNLSYSLRLSYYRKIQQLSFSQHDRIHTGDLMTRGMLDIEGVRMFVRMGLLQPFYLAVLIGFGAYQLISNDLEMALVALSFVPIVGWRSIVSRLKLRTNWYQLQKRMSILTRVMDENLNGIRVVRAFNSQNHEIEKFDRSSRRAMELVKKRIKVRVQNTTLMTFAFYVAMALVLLVGGLKVLSGEASVGRLTEFLAFMTILQQPVRQLGEMANAYARASSSGQRLFEILDQNPDVQEKNNAPGLVLTNGKLRFSNVSFYYEGAEGKVSVLRDISFSVRRGETIGIVGPPGAGKSTIAHLVPRFYDVSEGQITIDDQDIRDISLGSLRASVGLIQQDSFMFTSALEKNVAYGDPWADRIRIEEAATTAQLDQYINSLPLGYETMVGERGVSLSGGQRQRLSIARGVILKPPIMIFDDSTAAIDARTELTIRSSLREAAKSCATIIIAHRLSSLIHANEILFLEKGKIIERGSHKGLLNLDGRYAELFKLQHRNNTVVSSER